MKFDVGKGGFKMPTYSEYVMYFTIAFFGIIGLAALVGLARGFKKSLFNFITMALFYVVFFVTIDMVTQQLFVVESPYIGQAFGLVDPALADVTNFTDGANGAVQALLGDSVDVTAYADELAALVSGLAMFAVKLVYTLAYFTVGLIAYKILMGLIQMIFFGSKKGGNKNAGLGALVGTANGIMALFVSLIMFGGVMSISESIVNLTSDTGGTEQLDFNANRGALYEASYSVIPLSEPTLPDNAEVIASLKDIVNGYNDNIVVQILNQVTIAESATSTVQVPLNLFLFDRVLSFNYQDAPISIRKELSVFSEVVVIFLESEFGTTNNIADVTGDEIHAVFSNLSRSGLLVSVMPLAIEMAADYFDVSIGITQADLYAIDFEAELEQLGTISATLFDILNSAGVISGQGGVEDVIVDGDLVRDLFGQFADSQLLVLAAEAFVGPFLAESEGQLAMIITVPVGLDWSVEFEAIGSIVGAVLDAGVEVQDIASGEFAMLVDAINEIDLEVVLESQIVTNALINILSGDAGLPGLEMLIVPDGIDWYDTTDGLGNVLVAGELRKALRAVGILLNLGTELDIAQVFALPETDIDTLLASDILASTFGDIIYQLGTNAITIPDAATSDILVDMVSKTVVSASEIKNIILALQVLNITSFDTIDFGVGILSALEEDVVTPTQLDEAKIQTLLDSIIVHATVSKMVLDLMGGAQDVLIVPAVDIDGNPIVYTAGDTDYIAETEIIAVLQAFYALGIGDFADLDTFDVADILNNLSVLLDSSILHATISNVMLEQTGGVLIIPDADELANPIRVIRGSVEFVDKAEITAIIGLLSDLGLSGFSTLDFSPSVIFDQDTATLMSSASIRATIAHTILLVAIDETAADGELGLLVPTALRTPILVGGVSESTIETTELENLIDSLKLLGVTDFGAEFNSTSITEMPEASLTTLFESDSMRLSVDKMLKGNTNVNSLIPALATDALVHGVANVVKSSELVAFIVAIHLLGDNFTTVTINVQDVVEMTPENRLIVVESMIVRNTINDSLEIAVSAKNTLNLPFGPFFALDAEDYESNNTALFLTYLDIIEVMHFLNDEAFSD